MGRLGEHLPHAENGAGDVSFTSAMFDTTLVGGWFSKTTFNVKTKAGFDPVLALLVSHLVSTEYSLANVMQDLQPQIRTPPRPFEANYMGFGLGGRNMNFVGPGVSNNFNANAIFSLNGM